MKIGLGGNCHWYTEAIFQSLKGVVNVQEGWLTAVSNSSYSEGVIVHFDQATLSLPILIEIHLRTHSSMSNHMMRTKYRSAVYTFDTQQYEESRLLLERFQADFEKPLITQVLRFDAFKSNCKKYLNYYYQDPNKPFCKTFIDPKLKFLLSNYTEHVSSRPT